MQLNARNTIHNLPSKRKGYNLETLENRGINVRVYDRVYLYKLGASSAEECPPKIHTFPTTNHTAKKQSKDILKYSTSIFVLYCNYEKGLGP
jgi:hypothetical protein